MSKYTKHIIEELKKDGMKEDDAKNVIEALERGKPRKHADPEFKQELLAVLEERAGQMEGEKKIAFMKPYRMMFGISAAVLAVFLLMIVTTNRAGEGLVPREGGTERGDIERSLKVESLQGEGASTFTAPATAPVVGGLEMLEDIIIEDQIFLISYCI